MTSNGTPAKPNCAEWLRAGRNEIPVTQAPNVNTRWVVGGCFGGRWRGPRVCSRCTSLRRWPRWRRYVFQVVWIRMNPYGPISTRGGATAFVYLFPFSCTSLCKPNLISSFAAGGEKKKKKRRLAATFTTQPMRGPSTEHCSIIYNFMAVRDMCYSNKKKLEISRPKYRAFINLFRPNFILNLVVNATSR